MKSVKIKCPAKINLTLEITSRREDGFHNIKSIMQTVDLYDYLSIEIKENGRGKIELAGTSDEIPYNEKNLVYKAANLYLTKAECNNFDVKVFIDKNIPVAAGLAGGSTDAAGTLYGLNKIFSRFSHQQIEAMCASLGSDLNVCLNGGCLLATSRGEVTTKLSNICSDVTLIKPKNLGISAKEAYTKYADKKFKPQNNMTEKMIRAIDSKTDIKPFLYNDLEYAVFDDYKELQDIKKILPDSIMSGSGSTYFVLENINPQMDETYQVINNLHFVENGVCEI